VKSPPIDWDARTAHSIRKAVWVIVFSIAMAFVEAAVVVYLRALYYPDGFVFPLPLQIGCDEVLIVELAREAATLAMLCAIGALAGRRFWDKFAYFILSFGVWDIFYYIWLKVTLGWPASITTWDVLFLIPYPWIGPVVAPVSVACLMVLIGLLIVLRPGWDFRPSLLSWGLALVATGIILFSFMHDKEAILHQLTPRPYRYDLVVTGDLLYIVAFLKGKWTRHQNSVEHTEEGYDL